MGYTATDLDARSPARSSLTHGEVSHDPRRALADSQFA
jgi:hypothetical protein